MSGDERRQEGQVFAHDGAFWRRLASMGAQRLPKWWLQYSPPFFGVAAAVAVPSARHSVIDNLHRIRGPASRWRDTVDVSRTFASYAGCLAEVLANGSKNAEPPDVLLNEPHHLHDAVAEGHGVLLLTMHTGGWEVASALFSRDTHLDVLVVMEGERNSEAQAINDRARAATGVKLVNIGSDPLAALPLVRHLKDKGAVAFQIDRVPPSGRVLDVSLFDAPAHVPEGPFRLAQLSGAALVPVFCARLGFRRYVLQAYKGSHVPRHATKEDTRAAAQHVANAMTDFLRRYPTQWFNFVPRDQRP
jgi:phosphatidylinositol dimannoside acyltransferase